MAVLPGTPQPGPQAQPLGTPNQNSLDKPWYTFPRIDNFGSIDPQGNYWKPDSNVLTPPMYPVTSLYSGTVTDVQRTQWGQTVVTIKMDTPINSLATHEFYEHMHSSVVSTGQRIQAGSLIGYSNGLGEGANLGFGFYSGDSYGNGSAWQILQNDLAPGGAGLLNPVSTLNAAKNGDLNLPSSILNPQNKFAGQNCQLLDIGCWAANIGEHIAIFIIAIIMIVLGLFLLAEKQVTGLAKKAIP